MNSYKTATINNRRYLGNKYKLLPFIVDVVRKECEEILSIADIFAGTGAVSSAFSEKTIITNDIMYSNYICNLAWFGSEQYEPKKIIDFVIRYNSIDEFTSNYMTEVFSDTYFSKKDCSKIGLIREDIEKNYQIGTINERERAILITSLLYAMDRIAKTCGHYDAYRKNVDFDLSLELFVPSAVVENNKNNQCFNLDANQLVKIINSDLVYIDPPYNSRQYCDTYHLLENVARWDKPQVYGVAKKMNRNNIKSNYCTQNATNSFEDLINNTNSKYILFSYNNTSTKCNERSNAKISDKDVMRILQNKGAVKIFVEQHKAFTTGKSKITDNMERLFLCTCKK
jgi:adenine-specific DNA-methyltransferase